MTIAATDLVTTLPDVPDRPEGYYSHVREMRGQLTAAARALGTRHPALAARPDSPAAWLNLGLAVGWAIGTGWWDKGLAEANPDEALLWAAESLLCCLRDASELRESDGRQAA